MYTSLDSISAPMLWGREMTSILDAVLLESLHHPLDGAQVALGPWEPAPVDVAEDLEVVHGLRGGVDLGDDLLVHFDVWIIYQIFHLMNTFLDEI
jgi:hypothetical protein